MAITAAQRTVALTDIFTYFNNPQILSTLLPGVTQTQIVSFIQAAIGISADTQLSTVLANKVTAAQAKITADNADLLAQNANVTAWTVV